MAGALAALAGLSACGGADEATAAAVRGAEVVADPRFSSASTNQVACTDCHAISADDERILPGYSLVGAARRPSYWGGYEPDLKGAVDACLLYFMKGKALKPDESDARALFEYLVALGSEGDGDALPLTIVAKVGEGPPRGDPARGAEVHRLACARCHGAAHTGEGRLLRAAPVLPDQAVEEAVVLFPGVPAASVFAEKVRHGPFFLVGGSMPLFSLEALSDEDLGALLAFYGL
ncbi:c-type cytochrome [Vulgatibacter incomptus]|uniref:Putative lipoprotein n=1 Tax=Vulgatibacter incomptus TaxID=1391653 RepID=A0A0K1P880_9BACT|nr:c-type cytochrome [Vulgatibacter incomptus]AKU89733.1 putative lipoprotein [Vulgatibacter incomptus]